MKAIITPSIPSGKISIIPSKSYFHRHLIASLLTKEKTLLTFNQQVKDLSNDIKATIECIKALGAQVLVQDHQIEILPSSIELNHVVLDAHESGSTLRFMLPVALLFAHDVTIKGTPKLFSRGLDVYLDLFKQMKITFTLNDDSINIKGCLKSGYYKIVGNVSSQYITGLLFSLPLLDGDSQIEIIPPIESKPYIDITIDVLKNYGIKVMIDQNIITIKGRQTYHQLTNAIEGDYSNSAFLDALNLIGGNVLVEGLNESSLQGDKVYKEHFQSLTKGFPLIDLANCIDLGPILFTIASIFNGATFTNIKRLKIKESDRLTELLSELSKLNITYQLSDCDKCVIKSSQEIPHNLSFHAHNDHRLAMALSVVLVKYGGEINNCECVNKSYPSFYEDLKKLGVKVELKEEEHDINQL